MDNVRYETKCFKKLLGAWEALLQCNDLNEGDAPVEQENIISYTLIVNSEGYLDCEYKVEVKETKIITLNEINILNKSQFSADDIPF